MVESRGRPLLWVVLIMVVLAVLVSALWLSQPEPPAANAVAPSARTASPREMVVEVVETLPHDPGAYTQGLLFHDGSLYESTGQYGQSSLRRVDPDSGEVTAVRELPAELFGEGLARIGDRLVQLTWREETALIWQMPELDEIGRFAFAGEGWGLCFDGSHLVMSDGSSVLVFRDPETFESVRQVEVRLRDGAVGRLNELECVDGRIYANVFTTEWIVEIDPASGRVEALIDASGLLPAAEASRADVLNGIAWNGERRVFYLTGKLWPKLFAVRFVGAAVD